MCCCSVRIKDVSQSICSLMVHHSRSYFRPFKRYRRKPSEKSCPFKRPSFYTISTLYFHLSKLVHSSLYSQCSPSLTYTIADVPSLVPSSSLKTLVYTDLTHTNIPHYPPPYIHLSVLHIHLSIHLQSRS